MSSTNAQKPRIQTLARADTILSAVMNAPTGIASLTILTEELGLNKTTIFNLTESLVTLGFLQRTTKPKGYRLGLRIMELSRALSRNMNILEYVRP
jgi:DNA-binding IclR family transcriptional regulator